MAPVLPPTLAARGDAPATTTRPLRLAVLDAEDSDKWKGLTEQYVRQAFGGHPGDALVMFRVSQGELPSMEDIQQGKFDAIVVSGSHYSAYEDLPWIHQLAALLQAVVQHGSPRLLAVCFGHQLLSQALGGLVTTNPSGKFVLKVEEVTFDAAALERCGLYDALEEADPQAPAGQEAASLREGGASASASSARSTYRLIESHGDQVVRLPEGAVLLASSDTAMCEMWALPGRCLSCQFHAEFPDTDVALDKIHSALTEGGRLDAAESRESESSLRNTTPNPRALRSLFRAFMEGAAGAAPAPSSSAPAPAPEAAAAAPAPLSIAPAPAPAPAPDASASPPDAAAGGARPAQAAAAGSTGADEMGAELQQLVAQMRLAFNTGLQQGSAQWDLLSDLNKQAAVKSGEMASAADALSVFSQKLSEKQAGAQAALDSVPDLEAQLRELSHAVDALDVQSKQLARSVGVADPGTQAGLFAWR